MMKSMAEMQTEYFIACFALTLNPPISRNIIYFKQKNSSGCCCCLNGLGLKTQWLINLINAIDEICVEIHLFNLSAQFYQTVKCKL